MKKPKIKKPKLKKPKLRGLKKSASLPANLPNPLTRNAKTEEQKLDEALSNVPRITNETVSEHREEVLSGARKHIYPLQHSKSHIVRNSLMIVGIVIVAFFALTTFALYKLQATGGFIYDITRIVPFPVAKVGGSWVSYESYLFELRHNMHYYQTQQQANFSTKDGKTQLDRLKQQALDQVITDAYVKQLAAANGVSVKDSAVNDEVQLLKSQNRLGSSDRVFRDVLKQFWGWSVSDFKRELKQQMLQQAVVAKLDSSTNAKAEAAQKRLINGEDFAKVAGEVSEDQATKGNGGQYGAAITPGARDFHPNVTNELFKLKPGQTSTIIKAGNTLQIVKVTENNGKTVRASHIQFNLKDINSYIKAKQSSTPVHTYIVIKQ